ncbi:sirohydrochlorin chelatase, partial [Bacillus spizizenii]|uniref:sirohydrochlorin chelatase n=1 Tax=Bacillus spizizenii TaxID=96241 RepID=UPI0036F1A3D6|nr:sirohydrochlorin chelatase [Bacillus spizizenii]
RYPSVRVSYGTPIGIDEEVVKAVYHRMKDISDPYENARVVLIGRGSSDPDVKREVNRIAKHLQKNIQVNEVMPVYVTACGP